MNTWRECLIQNDGDPTVKLFQFKGLCISAFKAGNFPKDAAVFSEAVYEEDQVKFWVSPVAVQLLEQAGVNLNLWQAKASGPPDRSQAALLVGHFQSAWELLGV